ncbi:MAG: hypothetical protein KUG69_07595, partial [Marinosulfonomonas sp.]|nr:hypothetical protein [Marinosulfonomonas sp.]
QPIFERMRAMRPYQLSDELEKFLHDQSVVGKQSVQLVVVNPVQFQREKHQRRGESCDLVLTVGHEFGPISVGGVLVITQAGKGHDAPGHGFDFFVRQHAIEHPGGIQIGQLTFVITGKIGAGLFQPAHVAGQFRCILGGIKIA